MMTREQMESDKVGYCLCGLTGRWSHLRMSQPGETPEQWMRHKFECAGGRLGPHGPATARAR